jgi:hypothetical protein
MYNKTISKTVSLKCNVKSMTGSKSNISSFMTLRGGRLQSLWLSSVTISSNSCVLKQRVTECHGEQ